MPSPFIFLSHSGADTGAARELKRRLENSPDARAAGLKVWFDKDDLRPGTPWSAQIAEAIQKNATAFVVYVGSGGVMNWVESEVDLALSRATTDKQNPLLFIPVLATTGAGSSALPPFAKRYQGVRDPLIEGEEFAKLIKAVLNADWDKPVKLIDEPFVGLRSMREEEADRFFGRDAEVKDLIEKFRRRRIVAIVADSGTGKSSLAEAGFAPAFRGGALADFSRDGPDERLWHVVAMRPRANPEEGLRLGVTEAAEKLGRSRDERVSLRKCIAVADPSETAYALQCDLPALETATLLIVDQFEELFTATPDALVAPFVRLLLDLADGDKDFRVLLTVRADYFNLVSDIKDAAGEAIRGADGKTLSERLNAEGGDAILRLKRVSEEGMRDAVCKPLRLAGVSDDQSALVRAVQRDISDQPSDLPLLQVALKAAWREHKATKFGLLEAYHSVGGVLGALAQEAEKVRAKLSADDQARLESIFVRLVRLGDTGGATRRTALLNEFDDARRDLLQRLGDDAHGRLVVVGESSAEIAHEALITQWPWLLRMLRKDDARDVRRLDRLMMRSREWSDAPEDGKNAYLAAGAEREGFDELARQRPDWLSNVDRAFVEASNESHRAEIEKREREFRAARHNESVALTALANIEAERRPVNAAKLALAAWPRDSDDTMTPKLPETLDVLGKIVPNLRERRLFQGARSFAAFSRDGSRIVTASDDNTARVWDAATGTAIAVLSGHENQVISAAFSPDASRIVTASWDYTARVWDAATGNAIAVLTHHDGGVTSAAFNPDGSQIVTASLDTTARVWDAATGKAIAVLPGHGGGVISAAFNPDGSRIVTASHDNTARVWDAATGKAIAVLRGHGGGVISAAFSPDGSRIVTASYDKTARVWDAATDQAIALLSGHGGGVISAAFSPDGARIVTASEDKTACVWDAATGKAIAVLSGHEASVNSAAFTPDGSCIVTASSDMTARVWDAAAGTATAVLSGHEASVNSAAFTPDGSRIVTASHDKTARVWDAATAKAIAVLRGHTRRVTSAAFSPDGSRIVTASWDNTARVWDAATGEAIAVLSGHAGRVDSAAFSPDGSHIVTASLDKTARLWGAATGRPIATLSGHEDAVLSASFSPDRSRIVTTSSDKTGRVWDAAIGKAIAILSGHEGSVYSAAFSPDGSRIVTASEDKTARIWDAATGKAIATLSGHESQVTSAAFSPDGSRIVTASWDATVRVWDAATGNAIAVLRGHARRVTSAAFSPDGSRIVTASWDKTACVWDAATAKAIAVLRRHESDVYSAAFSPDGTRIVTASWDKTACLWDATTGAAIAVLSGQEDSLYSAAFSPDGTRVVTASRDDTARVWDVSTIPKGNILQVACALLKLHENPVGLEGVTEYPLTFDRPICVTDPPPPDFSAEPAAKPPP